MSQDIASARGVPVRAVGILYLLAMAVAVSLSCVTIGAILSTAVLIGPAAAALRLTKRPGLAIAWAAVIGLVVTWLGILLAYDSYYWPPTGRGWPVSFFVVGLILVVYLGADLASRGRTRRAVTRAAASRKVPGRRGRSRTAVLAACAGRRVMFSGFMANAWIVATMVAVVAGVVGFFTVLRGSAFVAHAVPQAGFAGAAGASLIGVSTSRGWGPLPSSARSRSAFWASAAVTTR